MSPVLQKLVVLQTTKCSNPLTKIGFARTSHFPTSGNNNIVMYHHVIGELLVSCVCLFSAERTRASQGRAPAPAHAHARTHAHANAGARAHIRTRIHTLDASLRCFYLLLLLERICFALLLLIFFVFHSSPGSGNTWQGFQASQHHVFCKHRQKRKMFCSRFRFIIIQA